MNLSRGLRMTGRITVYVNEKAVSLFRGMEVRHALISLNEGLLKAAEEGAVIVKDENGFLLGLDGALHEGARICTVRKDGMTA